MIEDQGQIAGNIYNKYETRNPLARWMVAGLTRAIIDLAVSTGARTVLDVGCGEGHFSRLLAEKGMTVKGVDSSPKIIDFARANTPGGGVTYEAVSAHALRPENHRAGLVTCIEVFEHLQDPATALKKISRLADPYVLLSVPREPLWRALNMARGAYLGALGNTPGHINHWSATAFRRFVSSRIRIIEVRHPLPWTVVLGRVDNPDEDRPQP